MSNSLWNFCNHIINQGKWFYTTGPWSQKGWEPLDSLALWTSNLFPRDTNLSNTFELDLTFYSTHFSVNYLQYIIPKANIKTRTDIVGTSHPYLGHDFGTLWQHPVHGWLFSRLDLLSSLPHISSHSVAFPGIPPAISISLAWEASGASSLFCLFWPQANRAQSPFRAQSHTNT